MSNITILWADDEIDLLKAQVLFLKEKGYDVVEVTNGTDAIEQVKENQIDIVFLDENMPGISGLEALDEIKQINPNIPVVMITKSEEENIMEEAIGSQITDYLIKPVKPHQILLTLKKIIDNKRLVREKTTSAYQQDFQKIFMAFQSHMNHNEWADIYKKLIFWELNLEQSKTEQMSDVFNMQKSEANNEFCKFVINNYQDWLHGGDDVPVMSHNLMEKKILPLLGQNKPTFMVLIDNLRLDQWKILQPLINDIFKMKEESTFYSILPTSTQYSRNAIFSGLLPVEIEKRYPKYWKNDEDRGGKNNYEQELLTELLSRKRMDLKYDYTKITNLEKGNLLEENILNYVQNDFTVIVYNFVDMLSHARTDMEVLKELAGDDAAYRSLTRSWFDHSPLFAGLKKLADKDVQIIFTTDHGTIKVGTPSKVLGDKNTTTNLRYKTGKNLQYNKKEVYEVRNPEDIFLPRQHVSSSYIFSKSDEYFVYPNNYNYYVSYFNNTFQHGGISLEEMIVPFAVYTSK